MNQVDQKKGKTVIILGAGIGGLTAAHILSKAGFTVRVYEKNSVVGGMARSGSSKEGHPTEYCWRIYGGNYKNLRETMKEIPTENGSVHSNLIDIEDYIISSSRGNVRINQNINSLKALYKSLNGVPFYDFIKLAYTYLRGITSCNERLEEELSNITWIDYLGKIENQYLKRLVVDSFGPFFGEDFYKMSAQMVVKGLETLGWSRGNKLSVMNGPTSEKWFDPWVKHLKNQGVEFHMNSEILVINVSNKEINNVLVKHHTTQVVGMVSADYYVCGLPIEVASGLLWKDVHTLPYLANRGEQHMVGCQFYFGDRMPINTGVYLPESPWQLIIEPQGSLWNYSKGNVKDMWSIGLDDPRSLGHLIKKPYPKCSREEIQKEVWHQILECKALKKVFIPENGKSLKDVEIVGFNLWDTFEYKNESLRTSEPKFSNNKGTFEMQPCVSEKGITNMVFATGYTRTPNVIFHMDTACTSGLMAANHILSKEKLKNVPVYISQRRAWKSVLCLDRTVYRFQKWLRSWFI